MKTYSQAPDAADCIEKIQADYHPDLDGVGIAALFVFDEEASSEHVLKHHGYPAGAVVRITPLRDRAQGLADASIIIDRASWLALSQPQREALIDHELTHLTRVLDEETEQPKSDVLGRPKLAMRQHDHQFGWFDEIAQRHGDASPEVRQAKLLMESSGQLYFDFGRKAA
jgi:Putative phage metallopeptidase